MADLQGTWKERLEEYKKAEIKWKTGKGIDIKIVEQICKETSIPALEAGLSAVALLAEKNLLGERTKEVVAAVFKHIASTKPSMKNAIKKIVKGVGRKNAEIIIAYAVQHLKDKNPKVVVESIKVLSEDLPLPEVYEQLFVEVLPLSSYLFAHGTGAVREEAVGLFQILAEKDPERVGEAVQSLRPVQIKEIFQPRAQKQPQVVDLEPAEPVRPAEPKKTLSPDRAIKRTARSEEVKPEQKQPKIEQKQPKQPNQPKQPKPTNTQIISLPKGFFDRFASADWKERVAVIEEIDKLLDKEGKRFTPQECVAVINAVLKKSKESNNKVFIASMDAVRVIVKRCGIHEGLGKECIKVLGKRLKDRKEQVSQAVFYTLKEIAEVHPLSTICEVQQLLTEEKASRAQSLRLIEEIVGGISKDSEETQGIVTSVVECCSDSSPEVRAAACSCLAVLLSRREESISQQEIEGLGIEKLLAAKIHKQTEILLQKKEEEVSRIVDSLCEEIRNTTITYENRSLIATPIKQQGSADMTASPVIAHIPDNSFASVPGNEEKQIKKQLNQINQIKNAETSTGIVEYVKNGIITTQEVLEIVCLLGEDLQINGRVLGILQSIDIPEEATYALEEALNRITPAGVHMKMAVERVRAGIERTRGEKSIFEEKCARAGLIDALSTGVRVEEEEIVKVIESLAKRSAVLSEEEGRVILRQTALEEYKRVIPALESVFPLSKSINLCAEMVEDHPKVLPLLLELLEKRNELPCISETLLNRPNLISYLEKINTPVAWRILSITKGMKSSASPYPKRVRKEQVEEVDINALLNDIIDQDSIKAKGALERLDKETESNLCGLLDSASTLVNVLLLQLNDAFSSGVSTHPSVMVIIGILKRACICNKFLEALDTGTLLSLTSDYIMVVTGKGGRRAHIPENIRKECGETLIKMCVHGPCASMFKIYTTLLCNWCGEEKVREVLVKLIWKHSKIVTEHVKDKKTVLSLISSLCSFYGGYKEEVGSDPLISKVLHLHLIEIVKYYGDSFLKTFKVPEPVLSQVQALSLR